MRRSRPSNDHAFLEGRPPPPLEGEISRRMRQHDAYEGMDDGGDAEEENQFDDMFDEWGVVDEEENSEVLAEYVTRDERARPMTAHASTGWQGRPKSAVTRPSSAVVALTRSCVFPCCPLSCMEKIHLYIFACSAIQIFLFGIHT